MGVGSVSGFPFGEACLLGAGGLGLAGVFITWEVAPNRDGWGCCLGDGGFGFLLIPWSFGWMLSCGGAWPVAGGWCLWAFLACTLVGMFGSFDILLLGSLIVVKKFF